MSTREELAAALKTAVDRIEWAARESFVVCGKPREQAEFEEIWMAEEPEVYAEWRRLRAFVPEKEAA